MRNWLLEELSALSHIGAGAQEQDTCVGSSSLADVLVQTLQQQQQQQQQPKAEGAGLDVACLRRAEALCVAAADELARQEAAGCLQRGLLLKELVGCLRALLDAALKEMSMARAAQQTAKALAAASCLAASQEAQQRNDERVALRAIADRHAARADAARVETEALQLKHQEVRALLHCRQAHFFTPLARNAH